MIGTGLDRLGEDAACGHAQERGAGILARNWRGGGGELDLVLLESSPTQGPILAFAEVKTRATGTCGPPAEAVTRAKVRRVVRASLAFLVARGLVDRYACRFDVFSVEVVDGGPPRVDWCRDAFSASDAGDLEMAR